MNSNFNCRNRRDPMHRIQWGLDRFPNFSKYDNYKKKTEFFWQACWLSTRNYPFLRKWEHRQKSRYSINLSTFGLELLYQIGFWCIVLICQLNLFITQVTVELWYSILITFWFECSFTSVMIRSHNEILLDMNISINIVIKLVSDDLWWK